MKKIPFVKYTSCGNNFVIVDHTAVESLSETEISDFSYQATQVSFGVGSDNLLVVQRCGSAVLASINKAHGYWHTLPDSTHADFLFRMFEPSGEEAFCCGNGLICVASYLFAEYGIESARVLTEIPLATPKVRVIGSVGTEEASETQATSGRSKWGWANMGYPRQAPSELAEREFLAPESKEIDSISDIVIAMDSQSLSNTSAGNTLNFKGYLVFTGEPHLVVFPDRDFNDTALAESIFYDHSRQPESMELGGGPLTVGTSLVSHIGNYLNQHYQHIFPSGINVNFARIHGVDEVENRCFERGINQETLACGTGALAVAYVVKRLHQSDVSSTDILPHRCRWHQKNARIIVEHKKSGWHLKSCPLMLFEGVYHYMPEGNDRTLGDATENAWQQPNFLAKDPCREPLPVVNEPAANDGVFTSNQQR